MSAPTTMLSDGYRRLIGTLRRKPDGAAAEDAVAAPDSGAPSDLAIRPGDLPGLMKRLSGDALILLTVAVLMVVLVTTLVIAIPASVDRIGLQQRLAAAESRLAMLERRSADRHRFADRFARAFMSPQVYKPAAARTADFKPDGLDSESEVIRSMLWQLKSHRGTAQFLAGRKAIVLRVDLSNDLPRVEWRRVDSTVPGLLEKLGIEPTERAVRAINIQINRFGFASLSAHGLIARDLDGRIRLFRER